MSEVISGLGPGLYVSRKLTPECAEAFTAWATEQGFANLTPTDELHTTIIYSRNTIALEPEGGEIVMPDDGNRLIQPLGDKGAVVLRFGSVPFKDRWRRAMDAGATWDYDGFHPHVTITYDAGGKDISAVKPFDGPLAFGPEEHASLDENWAENKGFRTASDEALTDHVGRLHYDRVPISKANICEYRGNEIPGWQGLGLKADKLYKLLRDPEELAKAASTFDGIQLLYQHVPVSADDHRPDEIVGTTGTAAEFEYPYLYNALSVWAQHAIDGIDDKSRHELSSSYHYDADMTPGTFEGQRHDGVMRNLRGNHVAVIPNGRAGPDVALDEALATTPPAQDEKTRILPIKPRKTPMPKKVMTVVPSRTAVRLQAALATVAMDSAIDFAPALKGLTAKNFKARKAGLVKTILAADGMEEAMAPAAAATGATPDDVIMKVLDMVGAQTEAAPPEADEQPPMATEPNAGPPAAAEGGKMDMAKLKTWLASKGMGDDDMSELDGMMGGADDEEETDEEKAARLAKKKAAMDDKDLPMVDAAAMDAAVAGARKAATADTMKLLGDIREAERACAPILGDITVAMDSADAIYDAALKASGTSAAGINLAGKKALVEVLVAQKAQGGRQQVRPAFDAALISDRAAFDKEHGITARPIRHLG